MAGTTVDDRGAVYLALRAAVEGTGATVADDDLQEWMGTDKATAIAALLRLDGMEPSDELVTERFAVFRADLDERYRQDPPTAMPGVVTAFHMLRRAGVRIALTTGFDGAVATSVLAALGWTVGVDAAGRRGTVDALVTTSDVPAGRPAPYMIHRAMERTGATDVRAVLAAGDTIVDLRAARNAGVIAVGVCTGALDRETLEAEPHDHVLDGVRDVPTLLGLSVTT